MHDRRVDGAKLRGLRERALLSTAELATRVRSAPRPMRCAHRYLVNIEAGSDQPSGLLAHKLAVVLTRALNEQVTVDDFSEAIDEAPDEPVDKDAA